MARDRTFTQLGVVHCSATPGNRDYIDIDEINRWHYIRGIYSPRGKSGYHSVILRNGEEQMGRQPTEIGAHAIGHNANSVAVCLVGGVAEDNKTPEDNFTVAQWDTLKRRTDAWLSTYPEIIITGHRDLRAPKACPSFDVNLWLREFYGDEFANRHANHLAEYLREYDKRPR